MSLPSHLFPHFSATHPGPGPGHCPPPHPIDAVRKPNPRPPGAQARRAPQQRSPSHTAPTRTLALAPPRRPLWPLVPPRRAAPHAAPSSRLPPSSVPAPRRAPPRRRAPAQPTPPQPPLPSPIVHAPTARFCPHLLRLSCPLTPPPARAPQHTAWRSWRGAGRGLACPRNDAPNLPPCFRRLRPPLHPCPSGPVLRPIEARPPPHRGGPRPPSPS